MNPLYKDAILKAGKVRKQLGLNMFQPLNIFDSCTAMGISVKFVDVNMEGLYVKQGITSTILLSNQRPLPRRCFTCGHELGHHVFSHGLKADILSGDTSFSVSKDSNEILVDAFAAALLMPVGGIQAEFAKRNWNFQDASPFDYYTICSIFGVGYKTLVIHCKVNDLISETKAAFLLKLTPGKIFKDHFGNIGNKSYFRIIDGYSSLSVVDLEVSNYIVVPTDIQIGDEHMEKIIEKVDHSVYVAKHAGITSASSTDRNSGYFIRIQREHYIGFAEYRHLEN